MQPAKINFKIYQGATFKQVLRWESETKVYAPITAVAKSAPVRITISDPLQAPPPGWRVWVTGVLGMKELNNTEDNYYQVSSVAAGVIEINSVNASQFGTYTSGGHLIYNQPVPLGQYVSARMQIREDVDAPDVLLSLTSANQEIIIDNTDKQLQVIISADKTKLLDFSTGVYDLELVSASGEVIRFAQGTISLSDEVTK